MSASCRITSNSANCGTDFRFGTFPTQTASFHGFCRVCTVAPIGRYQEAHFAARSRTCRPDRCPSCLRLRCLSTPWGALQLVPPRDVERALLIDIQAGRGQAEAGMAEQLADGFDDACRFADIGGAGAAQRGGGVAVGVAVAGEADPLLDQLAVLPAGAGADARLNPAPPAAPPAAAGRAGTASRRRAPHAPAAYAPAPRRGSGRLPGGSRRRE